MAEKQIAVGDPVLWYGHDLNVVALHDRDGVALAEVADVAGLTAREEAAAQIRALRAEQASATGEAHAALTVRIHDIDAGARQALVRARLRVDLLTWWEDRGVWVSDGRILTDAQIDQWQKIAGKRPLPHAQREVLVMLEGRA